MRFSIVIPTRDRIELLAVCFRALGELAYPKAAFEVIVVDDAGARPAGPGVVPTPEGIAIRFLRLSENGGPAVARNHGACQAAGQYLLFMDDDCVPRPDLLCQFDRVLTRFPNGLVGGRVEFAPRTHLVAAASQAMLDAAYRYRNPDPWNARWFAGPCLVIPAAAFHALGRFNPSYRTYEDHDFCARWRRQGGRLVHAPEAVVVHRSSESLSLFCRRHYHYGRGAYRFRSAEAGRTGSALRLEPAGFYVHLLTSAWRCASPLGGAAVAAVVAFSQVASGAGFLNEWRSAQTSNGRNT
jgi:GT2 family glycosyltransferase